MLLVDVYCGGGLVSRGMKQAGMTPLLGIDWLADHHITYQANFPQAHMDQLNLFLFPLSRSMEKYGIHYDYKGLIWLSPPCAGFSVAGGQSGAGDVRNTLLIKGVQEAVYYPNAWIVIENTPGLLIGESVGFLNEIITTLDWANRAVSVWKLNAWSWNLAQDRERVFVVCSPAGMPAPDEPVPPNKDKPKTLREAIHPQSGFISCDMEVMRLQNTELILNAEIPPGGNWESTERGRAYAKRLHGNLAQPGKLKNFLTRQSWDAPAGAITTSCRVGASRISMLHPEEPRVFNVGELRALQGVPEEHVLIGDGADCVRMLGNGVSVPVARAIGESIMKAAGKRIPNPQPTHEAASKLEMW